MNTAASSKIGKRNTAIRHTKSDFIFQCIVTFILLLFFVLVTYPLIYVVSASFSSTAAVMAGRVFLWPVDFSLVGYDAVFSNVWIKSGYANSFIYTFFGTIINLVMTIAIAYPISRKDFGARKFLTFLFSFTMFFGGGLIPTYLLISNLGLINTRWVMLIPGAISVWNMIIMRTFFESNIPTELLEAAQLDGCTDIKFLLRIVLPLSGAVTAVISLFYAVGHWNSYFNALIYLNDRNLFPLQIILREILILNDTTTMIQAGARMEEIQAKIGLQQLLKYSLIVVASVPVLIIYPFAQKYFVKGVMLGSIKG